MFSLFGSGPTSKMAILKKIYFEVKPQFCWCDFIETSYNCPIQGPGHTTELLRWPFMPLGLFFGRFFKGWNLITLLIYLLKVLSRLIDIVKSNCRNIWIVLEFWHFLASPKFFHRLRFWGKFCFRVWIQLLCQFIAWRFFQSKTQIF